MTDAEDAMIVEGRALPLLKNSKATYSVTTKEIVVAKEHPPECRAIEFDHRRNTRRNSKTPKRNLIAEDIAVYRSEWNHGARGMSGNYSERLLYTIAVQNTEYADTVILECVHLDMVTKIRVLAVT